MPGTIVSVVPLGSPNQELASAGPIDGDLIITNAVVVARFWNVTCLAGT